MKHQMIALISALCLTTPVMAEPQAHECVDPGPVFAEADAGTLDLPQLAQTVGTAELDGWSLHDVAGQIRSDFPAASDADVVDILITAFCTYLNDDAPADRRSDRNVTAFEQEAYAAVYGGAAPQTYKRHGWLYEN